MNRYVFAATIAALTAVAGASLAQERVAKSGAVKPARTATSHADAAKATTPTPAAAPSAPSARTAPDAKAPNGSGTDLVAPTTSGVVDEHVGQDLADVKGTTQSSSGSGAEERAVAAVVVSDSAVPRPVASPRVLRRINADRVTPKLAEAFHACYAADSTDKTAEFAIVRLGVAGSGDIDSAKVDSGASASPAVVACMIGATTGTKFSAPGGIGTVVLVQVRTR